VSRVANLAFLKPDLDNLAFSTGLAFYEVFGVIAKAKKSLTKSGFFWIFS